MPAPTVFSYVASRNKRGNARGGQWAGAAPCSRTLCGRTPGRNSNSRRASGVLRASRWEASGPRGSSSRRSSAPIHRSNSIGFGLSPIPERLCEPQKQQSIHLLNSFGFILDHNSSSPPAVNATSPDELQSAAGGGGELRDSSNRKSTAPIQAPYLAQRGPKLAPFLRPVCASLRLRCRSAAFSRACAVHSISAVSRNS